MSKSCRKFPYLRLLNMKARLGSDQCEFGRIIEFRFFSGNHSVARAAYQHPCVPYESIVPGKVGFFSGFQLVDHSITEDVSWPFCQYLREPASPRLLLLSLWANRHQLSHQLPSWNLLINDTDPVFYYCSAPNSCIGSQMVGVINPVNSI